MKRTYPQPAYFFCVCRLCGRIFGEPASAPFCDLTCAANWAHIMVPGHLDMIICEAEPHPKTRPHADFKAAQAAALMLEVWPC
jgi:hypothetical protein